MLGKLLTSLGLGQDDLKNVFTQTIDRLKKMDFVTPDMRKGHAQAIQVMLDTLRDEDVMNADVKRDLEMKLEKFVR